MRNRPIFSTAKRFSLLLIGILTISCNQATENRTETVTAAHELKQRNLAKWEQEIKLNQGAPWRANRATSVGIVNMYGIIEESAPSSKAEYTALAADLNQEMNMLINRCTMTGPSHDNLHVYLEPLLRKLAELKETESAEEGKRLTSEIQEHLKLYNRYFI